MGEPGSIVEARVIGNINAKKAGKTGEKEENRKEGHGGNDK